ncbi:peptidase U32 family protein [Paenilisteria rocourtiae]|uniref:Collagenase-like PrtC family protease n=1 Tax=Listeria rocourtiae TaxID=647910 RepID=A0A4R6ZSY7_9LIST|nr:peptidase U32 family protein [Listeria rocourtiae]EUJ43126.1 putative protease [Listeria rocourtiae FSL F6-920]TDR55572.1 collagenase-like PrtC family protease [Listeria rocourtiae]
MNIIATAESVLQAELLLGAGVDTLYVGGSRFGLRMPQSLTLAEISEITNKAHEAGKKVLVAVNALMHNEHLKDLPAYLRELSNIKVDAITVGDPGVVFMLHEMGLDLPFIYDAQTFVTSAEQVNFWVGQGAVGAVMARELTLIELEAIMAKMSVPIEVQVYGPTCIHQSKRKLVTNYQNIVEIQDDTSKDRGLYLREPNDTDSQLPIYEDENGTHIFSTEDLSLMPYLERLYSAGLRTWKLDGVLLPGEDFVAIVTLFIQAKEALVAGDFIAETFVNRLAKLQPETRVLGTGFFLKQPDEVK